MRWRILLGVAVVVPLATASVMLVHDKTTGSLSPVGVEVPFGSTINTDSVGPHQTNGSATVSGTLSLTSQEIFYINNTNTSGLHYARLELISAENAGALDTLKIGIDNGTQTDQIVFDAGTLTSSTGPYVQLPAGSTNTIYVQQSLGNLLSTPKVTFWLYSADDPEESAFVKTRANLTLQT